MKKLTLLLIPAVLFFAAFSFKTAKEFTIKGIITNSTGETLIGASVLIKGTTRGTITDFDGKFSVPTIDSCANLVISYTGFQSLEQKACADTDNKFVLKEGLVLSEAVVIAYKAPLIESDATTSGKVISHTAKKSRPKRDKTSSALGIARSEKSFSGRAKDKSESKITSIRGTSSTPSTLYLIDGVAISDTKPEVLPSTTSRIEKISTLEDSSAEEEAADIDIVDKKISLDEDEKGFSAGKLTAAEWSDLQNWNDWIDTANEDLAPIEEIWKINPGIRYSVIVSNKKGLPLPNAIVRLLDKNDNTLWQAMSDNTGHAELWLNQNKEKAQSLKAKKISASYEGKKVELKRIKSFEKGINTIKIKAECPEFDKTEILFVVDATGSMGDEIRYMQAELGDVINRVKALDFVGELRTGSVFYRDEGDEYLLRSQNISPDTDATLKFIGAQKADGGGDGPEAIEVALEEAILNQKWSDDAIARIAFVLLDAPPHQTEEIKNKMRMLAKKAAEKGIRIVPVLASGSESNCEYLMRAMALTTNSRFLFLTDDSGIGNAHAEPSVGAYNVVFLNDLIFRLIVEFSAYETCNDQDIPDNQQQAEGEGNSFDVTCYPIPANEYVFVNLENDVEKLEILDIQGQLLITKPAMPQGVSTVYINNLPSGTYVFRFTKEKKVQTLKVIKN